MSRRKIAMSVLTLLLALLVSCRPQPTSDVKIIEEDPALLGHESTYYIQSTIGESKNACSSVAISPSTLLTASHCAIDEQGTTSSDVKVFVDQKFHQAKKVFVSAKWIETRKNPLGGYPDLAVLEFGEKLFLKPAKIASVTKQVDTSKDVMIAGFGNKGFMRHDLFVKFKSRDEKVFQSIFEDSTALFNKDAFTKRRAQFEIYRDPNKRATLADDDLKWFQKLDEIVGRIAGNNEQTKASGGKIKLSQSTSSPESFWRIVSLFKDDQTIPKDMQEMFQIRLTTPDADSKSSAASSGDSGGPMFDADGELIGIAATVSPSGVYISNYTSILSKESQEFFARVRANGGTNPHEQIKPDSTSPDTTPPDNQNSSELYVTLASSPNPTGKYFFALAAPNTASSAYYCLGINEVSCSERIKKNESDVAKRMIYVNKERVSQMPATQKWFQTLRAINLVPNGQSSTTISVIAILSDNTVMSTELSMSRPP
jgi:hypothetical protein